MLFSLKNGIVAGKKVGLHASMVTHLACGIISFLKCSNYIYAQVTSHLSKISIHILVFPEFNFQKVHWILTGKLYKTNLSKIVNLWLTMCCGPWMPASWQYSFTCWSIFLQMLTTGFMMASKKEKDYTYT